MALQLTLFDDITFKQNELKMSRSGTFLDNMALPVHQWFRYSAGFAAQWVEQVLDKWEIGAGQVVLDPFAGSGTVSVACDSKGVTSIGVDAHPVVARICKAKLLWPTSVERFSRFAEKIMERADTFKTDTDKYPILVHNSYDVETLAILDGIKKAWIALNNDSPESELTWLAITAVLRSTSKAGTAQWQYILPNKQKKRILSPRMAFHQQVEMMKEDMWAMQSSPAIPKSEIFTADARKVSEFISVGIDAVITSPPYANNYDYADALRFEMSFWGDVEGWGDIHEKVRRHLIVSSSQHSSKEKLQLDDLLETSEVAPIHGELATIVRQLAIERNDHGGKKHYHTMVAAYCRDIAQVLNQLRQVCNSGSNMCWVIGDSAPYGIYCPIDKWIGELALAAGFKTYEFEKLRDRNTKWKNRKHRVPLKEGLLWIKG
jgi:DNA modification methylase